MATIEVQGVNLVADEFERYPRRAQRAIVRALDRGGSAADTLMSRAVARDTGLKVGDVKASFKRRKPSLNDPVFSLAAGFQRIPLMKFGARGPMPSRGRGKGVSYRMGAGNSRNRLPHAFIAQMRSGHTGVFARVGKARLGIRELRGPSLGRVFAKYRPEAQARGLEVFGATLDHELERARNAD
jgi:hypothetical protein